MIQAILVWGFPAYLIVVEMIFRAAFHQDTTGFIGPTIATAGLTSLIALTTPKKPSVRLSAQTLEALRRRNLIPVHAGDQNLVKIVWSLILVALLVWFFSCAASITEPRATWWFMPKHVAIGLLNYFAAVVCATVKYYL
jgi:hypothetical protein